MNNFKLMVCCTFICFLLPQCGGSSSPQGTTAAKTMSSKRAKMLVGLEDAYRDRGLCDASVKGREENSYDTNRDETPDVRKVYLRVGKSSAMRLILICREVDLNADGIKDVIRYYHEDGRPFREELDRNLDGKMDIMTIYEDGRVAREEIDQTGDGRVDTKIFYEEGRPLRSERDIAGHSKKAGKWQPDRWEYYEEGHVVRVGLDLDGDGGVDRWDRDEEKLNPEEEEADLPSGENDESEGDKDGDEGEKSLDNSNSSASKEDAAKKDKTTTKTNQEGKNKKTE